MSMKKQKHVESARRFLWDEDDETAIARAGGSGSGTRPGGVFNTRDYSVDQSVNLMAMGGDEVAAQQMSSGGSGSRGWFRGSGSSGSGGNDGHRLVAGGGHFDEYGDASASTEAEEYIGHDKRRGGMSPFLTTCCNIFVRVGGFVLMCLIVLALIVLFSKAITHSFGGISREKKFSSYIASQGVSTIEALEDPESPQQLALQWLAKNDQTLKDLDLDDEATTVEQRHQLITRYMLAVFYYSTNERWGVMTNWLDPEIGYCLWHGIDCVPIDQVPTDENDFEPTTSKYDGNARITDITLPDNGIAGTLPSEIHVLQDSLISLDLSENEYEGPIPTEIGYLSTLRILKLSENSFNNKIPSEIASLSPTLHELYLNDNVLEGTIPSKLGKMQQIRTMSLGKNLLHGPIPPAFGSLHKVTKLNLEDNKLTGQIPRYLGAWPQLEDLRLRINQLSGTIPNEIKALTSLQVLHLDNNKFIGRVPNVFDYTKHISDLQLHKNDLSGPLPETVCQLTDLKNLALNHNSFTGTISFQFGLLADIKTLFLDSNQLTGNIPSMIGYLDDITDLRFNDNKLSGSLPTELGTCFRLENLDVQENKLTGDIPTEMGKLDQLINLRLFNNSFTGITIPQSVCNLVRDDALTFLAADCKDKVECSCCQACY